MYMPPQELLVRVGLKSPAPPTPPGNTPCKSRECKTCKIIKQDIYKLHRRSEWEQHLHARLEIWCVRYNAGIVAYSMSAKQKIHYTSEWTVTSLTYKKKVGGFPLQPTRPFSWGPGGDGNRENSLGWHNTLERQRKLLDIWASHSGAIWNQHWWLSPWQPASPAMTTSITAFLNLLFKE